MDNNTRYAIGIDPGFANIGLVCLKFDNNYTINYHSGKTIITKPTNHSTVWTRFFEILTQAREIIQVATNNYETNSNNWLFVEDTSGLIKTKGSIRSRDTRIGEATALLITEAICRNLPEYTIPKGKKKPIFSCGDSIQVKELHSQLHSKKGDSWRGLLNFPTSEKEESQKWARANISNLPSGIITEHHYDAICIAAAGVKWLQLRMS